MTFNEIINKESIVLVDFFAEWCGPCKIMAPILEDVKKQMKDQITILKVDVDKNQAIAQKLQIRGVPTLVMYKSGKQLWRQSGVVQTSDLLQIINDFK